MLEKPGRRMEEGYCTRYRNGSSMRERKGVAQLGGRIGKREEDE
jgi:hypothetical protein